MNLADFVSYICSKCQMVGTSDIAAARQFVSKRYELIYNSYLWKDSLVQVNVTVDPTNADNAEGIVLCPEVIDRVVAIRTEERSVRVHGLEDYYRVDYDAFSRTGTPREFSLLSPVWFTVRPVADPRGYETYDKSALALALYSGFIPGTIEVGPGNGAGAAIAELTYYRWTPQANDLRVESPTGVGPVLGTNVGNAAVIFKTEAGYNSLYMRGIFGTDWAGTLEKVTGLNPLESSGAGSTLTLTGTGNVKVLWRDAAGKRYTTQGALPLTLTPDDDAGRFEIEAIYKTTQGALTVTLNDPATGLTMTEATIAAADTRSPAYQRVRVFNIPDLAVTLMVLGKKKFVPLTFDQEEPEIKNLDNCLIAFAEGDMWKRRRQMNKAQVCYQEAAMLLGELAKLETIQAAHNSRFIPDGGAGDPYFGPGRAGGFWC